MIYNIISTLNAIGNILLIVVFICLICLYFVIKNKNG